MASPQGRVGAHAARLGTDTHGLGFRVYGLGLLLFIPKKLEAGLRTDSAGSPYTLLLRLEAIGLPTFRLLL